MSEKSISNRIVTLDWLRGLCAISIMLYHFFFMGKEDPTTIFSKLGAYGVSTFFVLSGLSMAIVYNNKIRNIRKSLDFFSKRLFRIVPLYAIACILTLVLNGFYNYSIPIVFLNLTALFGFIVPSGAIPMGGWSIGNEMVFYFFTPAILFLYDKKRILGNLVLLIIFFITVYFAFFLINSEISLANQWNTYINPLNNIFLFILGIAIFYNCDKLELNNTKSICLLVISLIIFAIYPYKNQVGIVTGIDRIVYISIISIWVFCFYKIRVKTVGRVGKIFEKFGIATYGVYILHPIVFRVLTILSDKIVSLHPYFLSSLAIVVTIILAIISYYWFELKVSLWGKKIVKNIFDEIK